MQSKKFVTNQVIQKELLIARIDGSEEVCYLHNVVNGAKTTIRAGQSFKCGGLILELQEIMDDYVVIRPIDEFVKEDNEFILNEPIFGENDLVVTRLDADKRLCYCQSIPTGAKVSFYVGQRLQLGRSIVQLIDVTPLAASFRLITK